MKERRDKLNKEREVQRDIEQRRKREEEDERMARNLQLEEDSKVLELRDELERQERQERQIQEEELERQERQERQISLREEQRQIREEQQRRWEQQRRGDVGSRIGMPSLSVENGRFPSPFSSIMGGFPSVVGDDDTDEIFPPLHRYHMMANQPLIHFGNGNTIIFPTGNFGGEMPMSYEDLLNLQPVSTPAKNRDQLPEYTFKKPDKKNTDAPPSDCSICLMEYDDGESVKSLPCTHRFHSACIDKWLESHNTCPVCKIQVDSS